ncbi:MAG: YegP family protein [Bacilli bacterium]|jgi:uncharacterized protein YegP (UPF0339 family)|nr:YegP family protein [Bacilli bacterium]
MGIFVIDKNEAGLYFVLMTGNGEVVGSSDEMSSNEECLRGIEDVKKASAAAIIEDRTEKGCDETKNPKFVIDNAENRRVCWKLQASDGRVILSSKTYLSVKNALKGIASVKRNGPIGTIENLPIPKQK